MTHQSARRPAYAIRRAVARTLTVLALAVPAVAVTAGSAYASITSGSCTVPRLEIWAAGYPGVYCYHGSGTYDPEVTQVYEFEAFDRSYSVGYTYQGTYHLVNLLPEEYRTFTGAGAYVDFICSC